MELVEAEQLAQRLMWQHGLTAQGWSFTFDRAKRRAGACRFRNKQITLSKDYAQHVDEPELTNTVLHEIAHALVGPKHGHDEIWRQQALAIGCDAQRCHQVVFSKPNYILTCRSRCFQVTRHRINRTFLKRRVCALCGSTLEVLPLQNVTMDS